MSTNHEHPESQNSKSTSEPGSFHRLLIRLERITDRLTPSRLPDEKSFVRCFHGYGWGRKIVLRGRVERKRELRESDINDSRRRNFLNMASNFFTREIPYAKIRGHVVGQTFETTSDDEGYFRHEMVLREMPLETSFEFTARVEDFESASDDRPFSSGMVSMCSQLAKRIIISDVDDTVIETGASKLWLLLKNTLLENMHTRRIFEGVSEFYTQLQAGPTGCEQNPIFYVTSSPWNLRDFILRIFELRQTPRGPLFMTDWGIDRSKLLKDGHHDHKLGTIRHLMDFHAPLPVVLVGDSGEMDPEIYSEIVEEHPDRVATIYIRDVSENRRDHEVRKLAEACRLHGVSLHLVANTSEASADAKAEGLIA